MAFVQVHHDPDVLEVRVPFQNISTNDTNCYICLLYTSDAADE